MTDHAQRPPVPSHDACPSLRAQGLRWRPPHGAWQSPHPLQDGLEVEMRPGLHLVLGGEGRGKTALLGLLAGVLSPASGSLARHVASQAWPDPLDEALDGQQARAWLATEQARHPRWNAAAAARLEQAWTLSPHLDKQLHMLSAGSRRKLGLLAAAASGADLVLLDLPFAALDGNSRRVLLEVLEEAATADRQIWVIADYAPPPGLEASLFASRIDLGD